MGPWMSVRHQIVELREVTENEREKTSTSASGGFRQQAQKRSVTSGLILSRSSANSGGDP